MSNSRQKKPAKKSNKLLFTPEVLEKVRQNGGTVTYYSKIEKYDQKTNKVKLIRQPILSSPLTPHLLTTAKGEDTPFKKVLEVLTTTSASIGADYFTVQE